MIKIITYFAGCWQGCLRNRVVRTCAMLLEFLQLQLCFGSPRRFCLFYSMKKGTHKKPTFQIIFYRPAISDGCVSECRIDRKRLATSPCPLCGRTLWTSASQSEMMPGYRIWYNYFLKYFPCIVNILYRIF